MPEPKPYWTELLEPIDPSLKTRYKLLASIAISLKRLADQGEPQVRTASDLSKEPPRNRPERFP
jgi:hypothetical protein